MMRTVRYLLCLSLLSTVTLTAGELTEAQVTKILNDVRVVDPAHGSHAAALQETIKDEIVLKTGVKSRSELVFQDQTLTRLGPETSFSFKAGTRDMSLPQGTMLLQVPKGLGGAKIHTAAVTAAITGTTIMMENIPGQHLKVLVLEGSLRLSMNGRIGDSLLLLPGRMVIMPPNAKRIPEPVAVDLAHIMKTSALVKMNKKGQALPSEALIQAEIDTQTKGKVGNSLVETNLVIEGSGTKVTLAEDKLMAAIDRKDVVTHITEAATQPAATPTPEPTAAPTATPTPAATATPGPTATPGATATPTPAPTPGDDNPGDNHNGGKGDVVISNSKDITIHSPIFAYSVHITAGKDLNISNWIAANNVTLEAGKTARISNIVSADTLVITAHDLHLDSSLNAHSNTLNVAHDFNFSVPIVRAAYGGGSFFGPEQGRTLTLHVAGFDLNSTHGDDEHGDHEGHNADGTASISLNGGDAYSAGSFEGGSGGTLNIGDALMPVDGDVNIQADLSATTGKNAASRAFGGDGGTVSVVAKESVTVSSMVKVSDSAAGRASRSGGKISLESRKTSGTAINVTSSAQLLSLLSAAAPGAGGSIKFVSAGGAINVSGKATADRGTIDIRNNGAGGLVNLTNATLHGDVVKVGVIGADGTLNIGGGTIDANSALNLYATGGHGTVNFTDNVSLNGSSTKTISGNTVIIRDGKVVTISGPAANVFTDHPNYTGSGGNSSTTGRFGGTGANTQPFSASPGSGG